MNATCDHTDLAVMLRAQARGLYAAEAAAELLIGHDLWLRRGDFARRFISTETDPEITLGAPMAFIGWSRAIAALDAGELACSGSAEQILRIAASIAGNIPVGLRTALSGLDAVNVTLVIEAIAHANGRRHVRVSLS